MPRTTKPQAQPKATRINYPCEPVVLQALKCIAAARNLSLQDAAAECVLERAAKLGFTRDKLLKTAA